MNRLEAMDAVAASRGDAVVITGPGANAGLLYDRADLPETIYNMDMGYASAVALGVALACPKRRVLAIEGEGSFFAGSTVLSTAWRMKPDNLVVLVLDNGVWGTGDGKEPTATSFGLDLLRLALAAGWDAAQVHGPADAAALGARVALALKGGGPHFIVGKTDPSQDLPSSSPNRPRPKRHVLDCAVLMRAALSRDG
ncbi:MAG TPA: thiamine pyrophosphate-dependent enzyme [Stellaceae bacterium]|nr:thiamine pyrophosphate-dependent enzyme [Stellaceae bacterium]